MFWEHIAETHLTHVERAELEKADSNTWEEF